MGRYTPYLLLLAFILAACGGADAIHGEDDIDVSEPLVTVNFEEPDSFETGSFPDDNASLSIEDGKYIVQQSGSRTAYVWGQGGETAQDVQVEAQAQPRSEYANDLYGVMCRVDENGAGYVFLVSSDGFGAIARTDGRSLSFILDWRESDAIKEGQEFNTIRAMCVGDYLALYVNGDFVGDAEDDHYPNEGQAGLLAGIIVESAREEGDVVVEFDDLTVSSASLNG